MLTLQSKFYLSFTSNKSWDYSIHGQTVILHMLPLNYVIIFITILSQNLSILHVPVVKFSNELNRHLFPTTFVVNKLLLPLNKVILETSLTHRLDHLQTLHFRSYGHLFTLFGLHYLFSTLDSFYGPSLHSAIKLLQNSMKYLMPILDDIE